MSDLFNLYAEAGSPNGDDQPQSAQRWAADEISRLRADHERLVEALVNVKDGLEAKLFGSPEFTIESMIEGVSRALAALEAEKGGEL